MSANHISAIFDTMLIGYGRVSTAEQNPAHQIDALRRAGVEPADVHIDTASGAKASRPKLDLVLTLARRGGTIVITRLDRLGRSVLHLITLGAQLRERGIGLKVVEQGIDTDTAEGRAMFGMLSVLAELQRELILANTRDGLEAARARGRTGGRRPKLTAHQVEQAQRLYDEGRHTVQQIADILGVKRGTLYGHLDKTRIGTRPHSGPATKTPAAAAVAVSPAGQTADAVPVLADAAASVSVISERETRRAIGDPDDLFDIAPADPEPAPAHPKPAAVTAADNDDDERYETSDTASGLVRRRPNLAWRLKQTAHRNLPEAPAVCPNPMCGYTSSDTSERGRMLEDIQVVWLEPADDGGLVERRHCQRCRPRDVPITDIECAACDCGGPLLTGPYATELLDTGELPMLVRRWLAVRRWRSTAAGVVCPDHPAPR
ncbi:recombinase family protein [Nocardia carnea]|uniref:recombinase family protein n=1 Tax=Nocardia carnea TaxID=37328 RepID=UPI002454F76D|nr:recombinase family protein [Nocardia carnea]